MTTETFRWRNGRKMVLMRDGFWGCREERVEREPVVHMLKCVDPYFTEVKLGRKTFELRCADRDYRTFDLLWIRQWNRDLERFERGEHVARVGYILDAYAGALDANWVILSLIPPAARNAEDDALLRACRIANGVFG